MGPEDDGAPPKDRAPCGSLNGFATRQIVRS